MDSQSKQLQQNILTVLVNEWKRNGPPGIKDIKDIAGQLNVPVSDVRAGIEPLFSDGTLDLDQLGFATFLTPEGYERFCAVSSNPELDK